MPIHVGINNNMLKRLVMSTNAVNTNIPPKDNPLALAETMNVDNVTELYFAKAIATQDDFSVWSKAPYWTIDEATALSFGKNPKLVHWFTVQPLLDSSDFARKYATLRELITRAVKIEELSAESSPLEYMSWIKRRHSGFPEGLALKIQEFATPLEKPFRQSSYTKEMNTLYMLIYAVAKIKFGYSPDNNNHAATEIKKCVQNLKYGLDFEHSTILEKIRKGDIIAKEKRIT